MNARALSLFLLVLVTLSARTEATQMTYSGGLNRTNLMSSSLPMDGGFRFELGVFKSGFVPDATNTAQWSTNWVAAQRHPYIVLSTNSNRGGFGGTNFVTNNVAPFTAGVRYYFWGFRGSELSGEWILITRTNWNWPVASEINTTNFSTGSASAILGVLNTNTNAPFHLQSAAVSNASPPLTPWPQWATENLGTVPPAGGSGDLNTNGITDVLEYALHLNPGERPNPGAWLQIGQTNGNRHLEVRIPRRRDRPATFVVEVSTNLVQWTNGPTFTEIVEDSAAALVVRDTTPIGEGGDRRFLRVRTIATP